MSVNVAGLTERGDVKRLGIVGVVVLGGLLSAADALGFPDRSQPSTADRVPGLGSGFGSLWVAFSGCLDLGRSPLRVSGGVGSFVGSEALAGFGVRSVSWFGGLGVVVRSTLTTLELVTVLVGSVFAEAIERFLLFTSAAGLHLTSCWEV